MTVSDCTVLGNVADDGEGGGAYLSTGTIVSRSSDWGSGADDNIPDDVYIGRLGESHDDYSDSSSFTCHVMMGCR